MKNFIASFILTFAVISIISASNTKEIKIGTGNSGIKVLSCSETGLQLSLSFNSLKFIDVTTIKGSFCEIISDGFNKPKNYGEPELPVINRLIELPYGAEPEVTVSGYEVNDYNLYDYGISNKIFPAQPSVSKGIKPEEIIFHYNQSYYSKNSFNESETASVIYCGTMRGVRIGRLEISPFRYNPVTNTIRVFNNIIVTIYFKNANLTTTLQIKEKYYSPYFNNTLRKLINFHPVNTKELITVAPVKYVIVADVMFEAALAPFIQWKTKKGFNVVVGYTNQPGVGTTTTSIKNYLKNLYTSGTAQDPAPSFVLLVGDVAQIPAFTGTAGSHKTDLYYCEYDGGGDVFPEVYYGRFSATNPEELQPQIDKTLEYEQYLMPDPSFLDEVVMVGGVDSNYGQVYANGQINYGTSNYFNSTFGLTSHTYLYPNSGSQDAQIISDVSAGCGFANYTAHGSEAGWADPSFSVSDITGLQNAHKYPLMIGNCCLSNKFDYGVCFGEALLRASNKGALGYIGASNNSYWDEDYYWGVGARANIVEFPAYDANALGSYDCMFHANNEILDDWYITNGQMVQAGNLAVTQGNGSYEYYWETYHLMGDPSLMVYFSVPPVINASYFSGVPVGTSTLSITTEPYAYVALSKDSILLAAQMTDISGIANLTFNAFTDVGNALVVITKQNRQPYIDTLHVITSNLPFVVYNNFTIDDANGNNNGNADFNEQFMLDITVNNLGSVDALNVTATLSSNDPDITILNNTATCGNVAGNSSFNIDNAFELKIADLITDQHQVNFTINISDGSGNNWPSYFNFKLNAPVLKIDNITFDDSQGGNDNNRFDPGEAIVINNNNLNNGHALSDPAACTLSSTSPYITVVENSFPVGQLQTSSPVPSGFIIIIDPATPLNVIVDLNFTLTAGSYSCTKSLAKKVGLTVEDWESGDFTSYAWQQGGILPWVVNNSNFYEGTYAAHSGAISDEQTSVLSITVQVTANDSLSFFKKVSCEPGEYFGSNYYWYDNLEFFINNTSKGKWDGEDDWSQESYAITAGSHTLKWVYTKDQSVSAGEDRAYIDFIEFPSSSGSSTNNMPFFTSIADTLAYKNILYTYNVTADDADAGDVLSITYVTKPVWLSFNDNGDGTAILQGTPTQNEFGQTFPVVLSVSDGMANSPQLYYLTVTSDISIPETSNNFYFSIYPIPLNDLAYVIIAPIVNSEIIISVFDAHGKKVFEKNQSYLSTATGIVTFDCSNFKSGVYYCRVVAGKDLVIKKFIVTN
jgi:hypothetical protein